MSNQERRSRPNPEEADSTPSTRIEQAAGRGRLKLFLGFAAGVGKTFEMLGEANRRKHERGQDVVIGYIETHGRKGTAEQIGDLEKIPRRTIEYKGARFEEMDADAVIARKPQWVIVDELAHTNVPGSKHTKRYEDVLDFLEAGINVLSTMNVQHLESLNDTVAQITGVTVRETVPDTLLAQVSEIKSIDITPRTLINRLQRGDIYASEKVPTALANFFTEGNLSALRELALREVAAEVERSVQVYRQEHGVSEPWQTTERVMVCLPPGTPSDRLLRRGWRIASRLNADIISVYVVPTGLSRCSSSPRSRYCARQESEHPHRGDHRQRYRDRARRIRKQAPGHRDRNRALEPDSVAGVLARLDHQQAHPPRPWHGRPRRRPPGLTPAAAMQVHPDDSRRV